MASPTPKLNVEGVFVLKTPFASLIVKDTNYKVTAIRRFIDIERHGEDVYLKYYAPYAISDADYQRDVDNNEAIVSLECGSQAPIYVPTSYISSFPTADTVPYHRVVVGIDLGLLPDKLNLDALMGSLKSACSDVIGVSANVTKTLAAHTGTITNTDHETLEVARKRKVQTRSTDYVRAATLEAENKALLTKIAGLEKYIKQTRK